ncbi:hypothetical protein GH714_018297 [Hevea brasiliensis]|uniref:Uncharacterized protein n=1 Tax=Hevea brasiliensis TaxID=3981 RepID=A0A6A6MCA7_HEVBR|nr:hypothetical protein GH714_018297 [Hevea brasiliensis]
MDLGLPGMVRNNLIWVVSKLQVQVDQYPICVIKENSSAGGTSCRGEVVEIDTWVGASGKNGMKRDWLIRSQATGHVFARATSCLKQANDIPQLNGFSLASEIMERNGLLGSVDKVFLSMEDWALPKDDIQSEIKNAKSAPGVVPSSIPSCRSASTSLLDGGFCASSAEDAVRSRL